MALSRRNRQQQLIRGTRRPFRLRCKMVFVLCLRSILNKSRMKSSNSGELKDAGHKRLMDFFRVDKGCSILLSQSRCIDTMLRKLTFSFAIEETCVLRAGWPVRSLLAILLV